LAARLISASRCLKSNDWEAVYVSIFNMRF